MIYSCSFLRWTKPCKCIWHQMSPSFCFLFFLLQWPPFSSNWHFSGISFEQRKKVFFALWREMMIWIFLPLVWGSKTCQFLLTAVTCCLKTGQEQNPVFRQTHFRRHHASVQKRKVHQRTKANLPQGLTVWPGISQASVSVVSSVKVKQQLWGCLNNPIGWCRRFGNRSPYIFRGPQPLSVVSEQEKSRSSDQFKMVKWSLGPEQGIPLSSIPCPTLFFAGLCNRVRDKKRTALMHTSIFEIHLKKSRTQ